MTAPASIAVVGMVAGGRMHIVQTVDVGDPVLLVHEPDNEYDPNAVAVHTAPAATLETEWRGEHAASLLSDADRRLLMDRQAGYLPRGVAAKLWLPEKGVLTEVGYVRHHPDTGEPAGFDVLLDYARHRR